MSKVLVKVTKATVDGVEVQRIDIRRAWPWSRLWQAIKRLVRRG